jgi:dCTP deaminase
MTKWEDIKPGILIDSEINALCSSKLLITNNYDSRFVKQTCYELRAGDTMWNTYIRNPELRKVSIKERGSVYLPAKGYATIMTMEELKLPPDCVGRIMTKGQLFSIGISAVNTYADPGFNGPLGITLINHSTKPIFIPIGDPIAKIEFEKLNAEVAEPYKGRHLNAGDLWPIPDSYYKVPSSIDVKKYPEELKHPIIKETQNKIRVLFILTLPSFIASILYWISNWKSMSTIAKSIFTITYVLLATLAAVIWRWKEISGFLKSLRRKKE